MTSAAAATHTDNADIAANVLRIARIEEPFTVEPLTGGRNNRAARVRTGSGDYFLKRYAHNPADPRDRLKSEVAFYEFAQAIGITTIPALVAADPVARCALFSFVPGSKLAAEDIDRNAVLDAAAFVNAINRRRQLGSRLPDASEAGFALSDHYQSVSERLRNLSEHVTNPAVLALLHDTLLPRLKRLWPTLRGTKELSPVARCISPSDFGFHNAIRTDHGNLCFVDFEYAGWDDPARMVCDFFLQVSTPVPPRYLADMAEMIAPAFGAMPAFATRIATLMPLYHLKWCALLLADFHPDTRRRREFAGFRLDAEFLERQLALARARYDDRAPIDAARTFAETYT